MALGYRRPSVVVADQAQAMGAKWRPYASAGLLVRPEKGKMGATPLLLSLSLSLSLPLSFLQTEEGRRKERVMPPSSSSPPAKSTAVTASQAAHSRPPSRHPALLHLDLDLATLSSR